MGVTPKPMGHPSHLQNHSQSFLPHLNSSKQTAFISTSSPSLSLVSKTITKPSPCTKLRPENLCPHKTTKMRFTALLTTFAFLAAGTSAQDLSSLLSEASSLVGTDTAYQSLLSSAASVLSTATSGLTGDAASVYSSATGSSTDNGVDRVVLPAMGAMGAAVLGLAASCEIESCIVDINKIRRAKGLE